MSHGQVVLTPHLFLTTNRPPTICHMGTVGFHMGKFGHMNKRMAIKTLHLQNYFAVLIYTGVDLCRCGFMQK